MKIEQEIFFLIKKIEIVFDSNDGFNIHYFYLYLKGKDQWFRSQIERKELEDKSNILDMHVDVCLRKLITKYFSDKGLDKPENYYQDIFIPLKELVNKNYFSK